ncbi:MAG: methylated-DNA--[protein]-cysteine S-methyltransferase [Thermoguttaceae bacterium]|jgi:methylated-DNA-[protein]-cysteine S-methyltransferase|nr:methylated-DNA--[protein]-cysteine S-methyltransferase [Thermoguttaceae bacterium]
MAIAGAGPVVRHLTFGHRSPRAAARAIVARLPGDIREEAWNADLVARLQAYAEGSPEDFRDIAIDPGPQTPFRARVIARCRDIPWGTTVTYGDLAARAGSPRAARAVGNCMAANRIPLIVPCHRVVGAGGGLGGFSAPGRLSTKRRLLALESRGGTV